MKALVVGFILILAAVAAALPAPFGLAWWPEVLVFLRGGLPILVVLIGFLAVFVGISDIKDKGESKKEEKSE
jgi:hypothetical protein